MRHGTDLFDHLAVRGTGKFRGLPTNNYPKGLTYHVRGVVDGKLVARYWGRRSQSWRYEVVSRFDFEFGKYTNPNLPYKEGLEAHHRWLQQREGT